MKPLLLAIMGPTSSGKSALAEDLGRRLDAQLLNADAFQIFRRLDIGTSKPSDRNLYKLLDLRDPNEPFGLGEWLKLAQPVLEEAYAAGKNVIVVGGTGLYIRALFEEYAAMGELPDADLRLRLNETPIEDLRTQLASDYPSIAATVDLANPVRVRRALEKLETPVSVAVSLPPFVKLKIAISRPPAMLESRIHVRIREMMQNGWIQEVAGLRDTGFGREDPGIRAIGYRTLWDLLDKIIDLDEAIETIIVQTRRYAKRQRTWLRSEPGLVDIFETVEVDAIRKAMERIGIVLG